jgi:3-oxoacyl-[acyl-carrier protein] reductase
MTTPPTGASGGPVAIVTGGSRGVGRATVRRLAARGYAVVIDYAHDQGAAESAVDMVLAENGFAVAVRADVTDELDVERLFAETDWIFGGVDAVVHAVGSPVAATSVAEVALDEFDALCRINTRAALIVNREAARQLRSGGAVVNVTGFVSNSALSTYGVYAATSAPVAVLTRTLAQELRERDITVNAVSLEVDRPCAPGRVADEIARLLSDDGHGLTGQVIDIDEPRRRP